MKTLWPCLCFLTVVSSEQDIRMTKNEDAALTALLSSFSSSSSSLTRNKSEENLLSPPGRHRLQNSEESDFDRFCANPEAIYAETDVFPNCDCDDYFESDGRILLDCTLSGDYSCDNEVPGICTNQVDYWIFPVDSGELTARLTCFQCSGSEEECVAYKDPCYTVFFNRNHDATRCSVLYLNAPNGTESDCNNCRICESDGLAGIDYDCGEFVSNGCRTDSRIGLHPFAETPTPSPTANPTPVATTLQPTTPPAPDSMATRSPTNVIVDNNSDTGNAMLFGVLGGVGGLCVGVVAIYVFYRSRDKDDGMNATTNTQNNDQMGGTSNPTIAHSLATNPIATHPYATQQAFPNARQQAPPYSAQQYPRYPMQPPPPYNMLQQPPPYMSQQASLVGYMHPHNSSQSSPTSQKKKKKTHKSQRSAESSSGQSGGHYQGRDMPSNLDYKDQGRDLQSIFAQGSELSTVEAVNVIPVADSASVQVVQAQARVTTVEDGLDC